MSHGTLREKTRDKLNQKLYAASKNPALVPAPTYVNSSTVGLYTGNRMGSPRDGANQNLHISCTEAR